MDPFGGFILKTVPGIHDPRISGFPVGTKNHEMRGPPYNGFILLQNKEINEEDGITKKPLLRLYVAYQRVYLDQFLPFQQ